MKSYTLKECPFCASTRLMLQFRVESAQWAVRCLQCFTTGSPSTYKPRAVELWNDGLKDSLIRRAHVDQRPATVEAQA